MPLKKEFKYYIDNQDRLLEKYNGRILVIKDNKVLGDYSSKTEALFETQKKHKIGTFLIQECSPGPESYTEIYHSRVMAND